MMTAIVLAAVFGGAFYYLYRMKQDFEPSSSDHPPVAAEFQKDMKYISGEIKKLYEERAQILAENDRLKRDLEALRKKLAERG